MIPKISKDCIVTVLAKATQSGNPEDFAASSRQALKDDQPMMFDCLVDLSRSMIRTTKAMTEHDIMDIEDAITVTSWAMTGLLYKSLKGQLESDELNELFGI